jgi:hypothetical protein
MRQLERAAPAVIARLLDQVLRLGGTAPGTGAQRMRSSCHAAPASTLPGSRRRIGVERRWGKRVALPVMIANTFGKRQRIAPGPISIDLAVCAGA